MRFIISYKYRNDESDNGEFYSISYFKNLKDQSHDL